MELNNFFVVLQYKLAPIAFVWSSPRQQAYQPSEALPMRLPFPRSSASTGPDKEQQQEITGGCNMHLLLTLSQGTKRKEHWWNRAHNHKGPKNESVSRIQIQCGISGGSDLQQDETEQTCSRNTSTFSYRICTDSMSYWPWLAEEKWRRSGIITEHHNTQYLSGSY